MILLALMTWATTPTHLISISNVKFIYFHKSIYIFVYIRRIGIYINDSSPRDRASYNCPHVIKLKRAFSLLPVSVFGLAFAAPALAEQPRVGASISAPAYLAPAGAVEVGYPYRAAVHDRSGECRVSVDIANGVTRDVQVLECSAGIFCDSALHAAHQMTFAPTTQATDAIIVLRWTGETPAKAVMAASR